MPRHDTVTPQARADQIARSVRPTCRAIGCPAPTTDSQDWCPEHAAQVAAIRAQVIARQGATYQKLRALGETRQGKPLPNSPRFVCGTEQAYQRHRRHSEPIDSACRDAHRASVAHYRHAADARTTLPTGQIVACADLGHWDRCTTHGCTCRCHTRRPT